MSQDITGFGAVVTIVASTTFPVGLPITQFADDSDPLDIAAVQVGDVAMGLNGDLVSWSRAVPVSMVLNVIPGSQDDVNLQILGDANRISRGKISAYDKITATVVYPDGSTVILTGGKLTSYNPGKSISSSGRIKTRSYAFSFEQKI